MMIHHFGHENTSSSSSAASFQAEAEADEHQQEQATAACSDCVAQQPPPVTRRRPSCVQIYADDLSYAPPLTLYGHLRRYIATIFKKKRRQHVTLEEEEVDSRILLHISCALKPGTLTAVLGGNGSGKSTFLKAAAGLLSPTSGEQEGWIKHEFGVADCSCSTRSGKPNATTTTTTELFQVVGYMPQDDCFYERLTVMETLEFATNISTLEDEMPAKNRISRILSLLHLSEVAEVQVGGSGFKGISNGQRRRLSLAQLLARGCLGLLLDEPTTGLDATLAYDLVSTLKQLAQGDESRPLTIAASLLQPSTELLSLFDNIVVLMEGWIVYSGPADGLLIHFMSLGFACPEGVSVGEFLQAVTGPDRARFLSSPDHPAKKWLPKDFRSAFLSSQKGRTSIAEGEVKERRTNDYKVHSAPPDSGSPSSLFTIPEESRTTVRPLLRRFIAALRREWLVTARDFEVTRFRMAQSLLFGVLLGTSYYQISKEEYQNVMNLVYFIISFLFSIRNSTIPQVLRGRSVFYFQHPHRYVPTLMYSTVSLLANLPFLFFEAVLLGVPAYLLSGLSLVNSGLYFFQFVLILFISNVCFHQMVGVTAALVPSVIAGSAALAFINTVYYFSSGFSVGYSILPSGWKAIYAVNPIAYAFTTMVQNQFLYSGTYANDASTLATSGGDKILKDFGVPTNEQYRWLGPVMLLILNGFYLLLNTLALEYVPPLEEQSTTAGGGTSASSRRSSTAGISNSDEERPSAENYASLDDDDLVDDGNIRGRKSDLSSPTKPSSRIQRKAPDEVLLAWRDITYSIEDDASSSEEAAQVGSGRFWKCKQKWKKRATTTSGVEMTLPEQQEGYDGVESRRRATTSRSSRPILRGVHGFCLKGEMLAVMGASGSGKSTLLEILAHRNRKPADGYKLTESLYCRSRRWSHLVSGSMLHRNQQCDDIAKGSRSKCFGENTLTVGFVGQFETLHPTATVQESLLFSARMVSHKGKSMVTEAIGLAHQLELDTLLDRRISAVSPGDMKRLLVAIELTARPSLLLLDEPTSGLDARQALRLARCLHRVVEHSRTLATGGGGGGCSVICTIHQPSESVFGLFDRLLLLDGGGVAYFGRVPDQMHHQDKISTTWPRRLRSLPHEEEEDSEMFTFFDTFARVPFAQAGVNGKRVNPAEWILEVVRDNSAHIAEASDEILEAEGGGLSEVERNSKGLPSSSENCTEDLTTTTTTPSYGGGQALILTKLCQYYIDSELCARNLSALESYFRVTEESHQVLVPLMTLSPSSSPEVPLLDGNTGHSSSTSQYPRYLRHTERSSNDKRSCSSISTGITPFLLISKRLAQMHTRVSVFPSFAVYVLLVAPLALSVYRSARYDQFQAVTDVLAFLQSANFVLSMVWGIIGTGGIKLLDLEIKCFEKEFGSRRYSLAAYMLGWAVVEMLFALCLSVYTLAALYWTLGFNDNLPLTVLEFGVTVYLYILAVLMLSLALRSFWSDELLAFTSFAFLTEIFSLFGGVFINYHSLSSVYKWIYWINPMHYAYERIIVTQFKNEQRTVLSEVEGGEVSITSFISFYFNDSFSQLHVTADTVSLLLISLLSWLVFGVFMWWRVRRVG